MDNTTVQTNNSPVLAPWEMATAKQIAVVKSKCTKYYQSDKINEWNRRFDDFEQILRAKLTKRVASEIIDITGTNHFRNFLTEEEKKKVVNILKINLLI